MEGHGQIGATQNGRGVLDRVIALLLFGADIQEPYAGPIETQNGVGEGLAHHREIHQLFGGGADIGAAIQHHGLAAQGGPDGGDGGT